MKYIFVFINPAKNTNATKFHYFFRTPVSCVENTGLYTLFVLQIRNYQQKFRYFQKIYLWYILHIVPLNISYLDCKCELIHALAWSLAAWLTLTRRLRSKIYIEWVHISAFIIISYFHRIKYEHLQFLTFNCDFICEHLLFVHKNILRLHI